MCRWTGYDPFYFLLRCVRTAFRRPWAIGALVMMYGYISAEPSPFPPLLRKGLRDEQRARLRSLLRHPVRWLKEAYGLGFGIRG